MDYYSQLYYNSEPEIKRHFQSLYPEFTQLILDDMRLKAKLYTRWEVLKIMVPENWEDVLLIYLVKKLGLPPPSKNWWKPVTKTQYDDDSNLKYRNYKQYSSNKEGVDTVPSDFLRERASYKSQSAKSLSRYFDEYVRAIEAMGNKFKYNTPAYRDDLVQQVAPTEEEFTF